MRVDAVLALAFHCRGRRAHGRATRRVCRRCCGQSRDQRPPLWRALAPAVQFFTSSTWPLWATTYLLGFSVTFCSYFSALTPCAADVSAFLSNLSVASAAALRTAFEYDRKQETSGGKRALSHGLNAVDCFRLFARRVPQQRCPTGQRARCPATSRLRPAVYLSKD